MSYGVLNLWFVKNHVLGMVCYVCVIKGCCDCNLRCRWEDLWCPGEQLESYTMSRFGPRRYFEVLRSRDFWGSFLREYGGGLYLYHLGFVLREYEWEFIWVLIFLKLVSYWSNT
jgi:hypothetical protein